MNTRNLSWVQVVCLTLFLATRLIAAPAVPVGGKELAPIQASVPRGFCEAPFSLKLAMAGEVSGIRYTVDGSEPSLTNGTDYRDSLAITNTTTLRAAAFKDRARVSSVSTYTYIFLDQVIRQPANPPGLPSGPNAWQGHASVYGMDQRVVNDPLYRDKMKDAFMALPILSVVCRKDAMFAARTGLYVNSTQRGESWERACSVELILPDGSTGFQVDCGIRIQGNYNRLPEKSPKHSFRLIFNEKYGLSKLRYQIFPDSPVKKFDTLVLRADYNNSWIHWDPNAQPRAQRTRDAWLKDSHRAMGWTAGHNRYAHLFLNGLYWGVYDAAERPDASFAAAYLGGERKDYDVINEFQVKDGTGAGFNALASLRGLARPAQYEKLQQQLNLTEYMDYLLLNYYAGNEDWGENKNWYAIRSHTPPGPFQFIVWDGEQIFQNLNDDTVNSPFETPFRLALELRTNPEFRLAFADRVQVHFFNDGALTAAASSARWMARAAQVERAIIAESARWGSYRRNPPYTRDADWLAEQRRLLKTYFPQRTTIVLQQLRAAGLYPRVAAPVYNQHGGKIEDNFKLTIASANGGSIYFTTNGTDPRVIGSSTVSSNATLYAQTVPIQGAARLKARVLKDSTWSALTEAQFTKKIP